MGEDQTLESVRFLSTNFCVEIFQVYDVWFAKEK